MLKGNIYPVDLELYIRGYFPLDPIISPSTSMQSSWKRRFLFKGSGWNVQHPGGIPGRCEPDRQAVDDMFRNSPQPTKTETEKAFGLEFVAMMGNVKVSF